jgi:hypothetical protein
MIAGTTEYFHKIQYNGNSVVFRCIVFYFNGFAFFWDTLYRVYQKKRNLGISQEIDIVLKTKDFRRLGI